MAKKNTVTVKDSGFDAFVKNMTKANKGDALIGVFGESKNKDGLSIAEYATQNEFGAGNIPERSFLRSTYDEEILTARKLMSVMIRKWILKKNPFERGLIVAAKYLVSEIKQKITNSKSWAIPNSPRTIAAKSKGKRIKDTPLIDTGALRNAITYKIKI